MSCNFGIERLVKARQREILKILFSQIFLQPCLHVSKSQPASSVSSKSSETWQTQTCTFAFSSLGIWEPGLDGTDINETARYHNHLFVGDDFGRIRVYNYPCWKVNSEHKKLFGHSSHVTRVKVSKDGSVMASAGGMDGAVLVWHNPDHREWVREQTFDEEEEDQNQDEGQQTKTPSKKTAAQLRSGEARFYRSQMVRSRLKNLQRRAQARSKNSISLK